MNQALKISIWNMRGFSSSVPYLRELVGQNDIVLLSEHWLHENRLCKFRDVSVDVNFCARSSKAASADNYGTRRGQGGVAILWRKSLKGISEIKEIMSDRMCGIRMQTAEGGVVNIIAVYMPSAGSCEDYSIVLDELAEIVASRETGSISIVG